MTKLLVPHKLCFTSCTSLCLGCFGRYYCLHCLSSWSLCTEFWAGGSRQHMPSRLSWHGGKSENSKRKIQSTEQGNNRNIGFWNCHWSLVVYCQLQLTLTLIGFWRYMRSLKNGFTGATPLVEFPRLSTIWIHNSWRLTIDALHHMGLLWMIVIFLYFANEGESRCKCSRYTEEYSGKGVDYTQLTWTCVMVCALIGLAR